MSVEIKKNIIEMTRGDTLKVPIKINYLDENNEVQEYIPQEGDQIRFAVKKNYNDAGILICKEIPWNTCELVLNPADTKCLEQPAVYVYDIQITLNNGFVATIIGSKQKAKLKIIEEVA